MTKKPIDPFAIYLHACRFLWSEEHLRRTEDPQVMALIAAPSIVLSSFTSELLLKCILVLETGNAPATHDLSVLFRRVSPPVRQRIIDEWDKAILAQQEQIAFNEAFSGKCIPRDLPSALDMCGKAFEGMRYIYEDPMKTNFYIIGLARILMSAIWEIKPDWKNMQPAPAKLVHDPR